MFMLLAVTFVTLYLLLPDDLNQYGQLLSHTVIFAANIFLSNEKGYFDPEGLESPLMHVWSLAVEEQYYLIWPLLLFGSFQALKRRHLIVVVVVLCCVSLFYSEWASFFSPKEAFFGLPSRAFELLIGAGLAVVNQQPMRAQIVAEALSICGLVLICLGLLLISEKSRFPGTAALIPCSGAALLMLSGGRGTKTFVERLLSSSVFVQLGQISYSWYLWHWPPLAFIRYYFERPLTGLEVAIALAVGFCLAIISWRFVERPFRRPGTPAEFRRAFLPMAICSSIVLLGLGTAVQSLNGIPLRMGKDAQAMLNEFRRDTAQGCDNTLKKGGYLNECVFGEAEAAGPSIMLWGDSHAEHYLPAIAKIATAHGTKGMARIHSDCRPFIAPEAIDRRTPRRRSCPKANEATLAKLLSQADISVVILAARWDARESAPGQVQELEVFQRNLERTLVALEQNGKKVIVLGQVPLLARSLKSCLTKQVRFGLKIPHCVGISKDVADSYDTGILNSMQILRQKHDKAIFFAPRKYFCDGSVCRVVDAQGRPLYMDDDHLNVRGAFFLEPYIDEAITPFLRSSHLPRIIQTAVP